MNINFETKEDELSGFIKSVKEWKDKIEKQKNDIEIAFNELSEIQKIDLIFQELLNNDYETILAFSPPKLDKDLSYWFEIIKTAANKNYDAISFYEDDWEPER